MSRPNEITPELRALALSVVSGRRYAHDLTADQLRLFGYDPAEGRPANDNLRERAENVWNEWANSVEGRHPA